MHLLAGLLVLEDEGLLEYAAPRQAEYIRAFWQHGSQAAAARALGVTPRNIYQSIKAVQKKAAMHGYAPDYDLVHPAPDPFVVKGTSTLYDEAGKKRLQWVKTSLDREKQLKAVEEWIQELSTGVKRARPLKEPKESDDNLLNFYRIGDPHFGMYAWGEEAGEDFDVEIASKYQREAISRLVCRAPKAHRAIIWNAGDYFHANDNKGSTPMSGNSLDVDTRFERVFKLGCDAMIDCIDLALRCHNEVVYRGEKGNHDPEAAYAMTCALFYYYKNEPRVSIDLSPAKFWYFKFGKCLFGTAHGDGIKTNDLSGIMACDKPQEWGETEFRHFFTGHIHHKQTKELPGVIWESARTLAPSDAWHAAKGYRSGREMEAITFHKDYGEWERHRADIALVRHAS